MANEIKVAFNLQVDNGFFQDRVPLGQQQYDQAAPGRGGVTQTFTDTEADVDQDGVTTEGFCYLRNLEATGGASWDFGPEVGTTGSMAAVGRLGPGEFAFFPLKAGTQLRGVCIPVGTAYTSCKIDVRIYEA